jgi:hypothetical protein
MNYLVGLPGIAQPSLGIWQVRSMPKIDATTIIRFGLFEPTKTNWRH